MANADQTDYDGDGVGDACDTSLLSITGLSDINGNSSPDVAVLRDGSIILEIRDGQSSALLKTIEFLDEGFTPVDAVALPDADGNGVAELGVLATRNSDGRIVVGAAGAARRGEPGILVWKSSARKEASLCARRFPPQLSGGLAGAPADACKAAGRAALSAIRARPHSESLAPRRGQRESAPHCQHNGNLLAAPAAAPHRGSQRGRQCALHGRLLVPR